MGAVYVLNAGDNTIGRGPENTVRLHDQRASVCHAVLLLEEGRLVLRDAGSRNGTYVNGERIEATQLHAYDQVLIGSSLFELSSEENGQTADVEMTIEATLDSSELERLASAPGAYSQDSLGPGGADHLCRLARIVTAAQNRQGLLADSLDHLARCLHCDAGFVGLVSTKDGSFEIVHDFASKAAKDELPVSQTVLNQVLEAGEAILMETPPAGEATSSMAALAGRSVLYAPLRARARTMGVIGVVRGAAEKFGRHELNLLVLAADLVGTALASLAVKEEALSDCQAIAEIIRGQHELVGQSAPMRSVFGLVGQVAPSDAPVLIHGETGTGKELAAKAIHANSPRVAHPFVAVNCASLPGSLLESTLFGHAKGAFTGAEKDYRGCFEQAGGGTLFLDEVAELSLEAQAKLLRVAEDGIVMRLGSEEGLPVDVRLVLASHRDLAAEVKAGRFREDLFYRFSVVTITLPPLRERVSDIPLLAGHFLDASRTKTQRQITGFSEEALALLKAYPWPGNVRELRNAVERAVLLGRGETILPADLGLSASNATDPDSLPSLKEVEKDHVARVLESVAWKRGDAARVLGIDRKTLLAKCKAYGLTPGD